MTPALVASGAVIAAGTVWWHVVGPLVWADPRVTIYQAAFFGTLAVALVTSIRSRNQTAITAALVLLASAVAHTMVHAGQTHPLSLHATINVAVATFFAMTARERWQAIVALSYLSIFAFGALSHFGYVPGIAARPRGAFIAWAYPDIAAVIGHFANIVVGVSTDAGHGRAVGSVAWLRERGPSLVAAIRRWRA